MSRLLLQLATLIAIIFTTARGQVAYDCPVDWVPFQDQCYHFVFYPTLPFDEASQACHHDGSSLVSVRSDEVNTFIVNTLSRYDGTSPEFRPSPRLTRKRLELCHLIAGSRAKELAPKC
ncbi:snaclec coagulation factor X-activating enzyme light chain 1-like [Babylonia areolata]|uniref:snaclec coagulation factor X-activating enzyme light chain 1-like n=1 Tax=Babylonia areolata TaxID=304850 RepID=UPI003FD50850